MNDFPVYTETSSPETNRLYSNNFKQNNNREYGKSGIMIKINSEYYDNIHHSNTNMSSKISPKNTKDLLNQENQKNTSNTRIKKKTNHKLEPTFNADDLIKQFLFETSDDPYNTSNSIKTKSKIHKDMENQLGHMYKQNDGLTIVSEEPSKQYTEFNVLKNKTDTSSGFKKWYPNYSKESTLKKNGLGKSIDQVLNNNKSPMFASMNENLKAYPMNSKDTKSYVDDSKSHSEILGKKVNHEDKKRHNTMIPGILNINSEQNQNITMVNNFNEDNGNMIETWLITQGVTGKIHSFKKQIADQEENAFFNDTSPQFSPEVHDLSNFSKFKSTGKTTFKSSNFQSNKINLEVLPSPPFSPNFIIDILKTVSTSKEIRKKESFVEESFFKLENGLFYQGNLKYGKLDGEGKLSLKSIDMSETNMTQRAKYLLYEGKFENNYAHGTGILYFVNGTKFRGSFKRGMSHGSGVLIDKYGKPIISGIWIEGSFLK